MGSYSGLTGLVRQALDHASLFFALGRSAKNDRLEQNERQSDNGAHREPLDQPPCQPPGRGDVRDSDRIDDILWLLGELWRASPDQRLVQLILNVAASPEAVRPNAGSLFVLEDDVVERKLRACFAESAEYGPDGPVH